MNKYLILLLFASCTVSKPIYRIDQVRGQVVESKRHLNDRWITIITRDSGIMDTIPSNQYLKPGSCYIYPITIKL